jgi:CubicO group peptidase (beta-lactamase class C family)
LSERGYIPDQVIGYEVGGESRYLTCWKRDPRWSPATGISNPALVSLDEAIEQFLIHRRIPTCTLAAFRDGRPGSVPVLSRGFGYANPEKQVPIGPRAAMDLGVLSIPFEAAAVHALVRRKKLREDDALSDILHAPMGEKPVPTLGRLLASLEQPGAKLGEKEREALTAMPGLRAPSPSDREPPGASELEGFVLGRVLEAATGKTPEKAIAAEVIQPLGIRGVTPAGGAPGRSDQLVHLAAPAPEVGRFFLKHQLDGRPISSGTKPTEGDLIGRRGTALGLVRRRGEWLFVLLLNLPDGAPPVLGAELCTCLEHAVDSLPTSPSSTGQRRVSPRGKGGTR